MFGPLSGQEEWVICPVLITNTDPHNIGTVGVVGSGGVDSTVLVVENALQKGEKDDEGEQGIRFKFLFFLNWFLNCS